MAAIYAQYPPDRVIAANQTFDLVARTYAINMNQRTFAGVDFNVGYDWQSRFGKWGVNVNGNKQTKRQTQPVAGGPVSDDIDTFVAPIWQGRLQASWAGNTVPLRVNWVANYRGPYTLRNTSWLYGGGHQLLHNLTIGYDINKFFKGLTVQARILNVTNADPPLADTGVGYDDDNHNPYGRQYTISLRAHF
jgi:hypothetical protein